MKQYNDESIADMFRKLRGLTLSEGARSRMRAELSTYADFHAASPKPVESATPRRTFAWIAVSGWWYRSGAALVAVLLLAGGTAYAAEGSLPGSPLYPVKVRINEPVELALAASPQAKAEKHARLAERRLEEAARLAVEEHLDEDTQTYLERKFGEHVDNSLAATKTLESRGETSEALKVRSRLEARLVAHADILNLVEGHLEDSEEEPRAERSRSRILTYNLRRAVELRRESVREARLALERDLEDQVTPDDSLAVVTATLDVGTSETEDEPSPAIASRAAESDTASAEARESLERDEPEEVRSAFKKASEAEFASEIVSTLLRNADLLKKIDKKKEDTATTSPEKSATTSPEKASTPREVKELPVVEPLQNLLKKR